MKSFKTLLKQCLTVRATQIDIVPDQYVVVTIDGKANPLKDFGKTDKKSLKELMQSLFPKDRDKLKAGQAVKGLLTIVNVGNVYMVGVPLKLSVHIFLSEAGRQQAEQLLALQRGPTSIPQAKPKLPASGSVVNMTSKSPEPMQLTGFDSDRADDLGADNSYFIDGHSLAKGKAAVEKPATRSVAAENPKPLSFAESIAVPVEPTKPKAPVALDFGAQSFEIERKGPATVVEHAAPGNPSRASDLNMETESESIPAINESESSDLGLLYTPPTVTEPSETTDESVSELDRISQDYVLETKVKDISVARSLASEKESVLVEQGHTEAAAEQIHADMERGLYTSSGRVHGEYPGVHSAEQPVGLSVEARHEMPALTVAAPASVDTLLMDVINEAKARKASAVHLRVGSSPFLRVGGSFWNNGGPEFSADDMSRALASFMNQHRKAEMDRAGTVEFSEVVPGIGRCHFQVFGERGKWGVIVHPIYEDIPDLGLFEVGEFWTAVSSSPGFVLVTADDRDGLRKLLAALTEEINQNAVKHIVSQIDGASYEHKQKMSLISHLGWKDADWHKQDPDVVVLYGVMDKDTIKKSFEVVQAGGLVIAGIVARSMNAGLQILKNVVAGADATTTFMLTHMISGILSLKKLPVADSDTAYAHEALLINDLVRKELQTDLAQDFKVLSGTVDARAVSINESLINLISQNKIDVETALKATTDHDDLMTRLHQAGLLGQSIA
jgi:twitching motility protein PilT